MSFKGKNLEQHREIKFIIYILLEICSDLVLLHAIFYLRDTHSNDSTMSKTLLISRKS